ncbi:MAG: 23S rRNA (uracil(1939)-C(5))-methyltransferase RlmD [Eubacteriales bacterium]
MQQNPINDGCADCGGCTLSAVPYPEQLAHKHSHLEKLLGRYGHVQPVSGMENPYHYRNKVTRSFAYSVDEHGKKTLISGTYAAESRRVVPIAHCLIEDEGAQNILASLTALCREMKIAPYQMRTGQGVIRHAQVCAAQGSGGYLLTIVTGSPFFPGRAELVSRLRRMHPEIRSIVHNVNGFDTGMILGDSKRSGIPDRVLYGSGTVSDTLCGLRFRISPQSFYQVNRAGTELLYQTAVEMAGLRPGDTVLDAYCGIGTIGLSAANAANRTTSGAGRDGIRVVGVEISREAVSDAIANAKANRIANARFYQGDAGRFLSENRIKPDVLFMDPPRGGSDAAFLSAVLRARPRTVVYISCGPDTLARDLGVLTKGYRVEKIQPVDLFPMTEHVETVCLLSKLHT